MSIYETVCTQNDPVEYIPAYLQIIHRLDADNSPFFDSSVRHSHPHSHSLRSCSCSHSKSDVNGPAMNPLFAWLKSQPLGRGLAGTTAVKWNFEKFLVGKDGKLIARYSSLTTPEKLVADIENALAQ